VAALFVMRRLCRLNLALLLGALLCAPSTVVWAESGYLVVHVRDVQRPVSGMQIGVKGAGGATFTGDDGNARIPLAPDTRAGSRVFLQILKSPPGKDYVMKT